MLSRCAARRKGASIDRLRLFIELQCRERANTVFGVINNNKKDIKTIACGDALRTKCLQAHEQRIRQKICRCPVKDVRMHKSLMMTHTTAFVDSLVSAGRHFS